MNYRVKTIRCRSLGRPCVATISLISWRTMLLTGVLSAWSAQGLFAASTFLPLGLAGGTISRATDVSADGSVVVGFSNSGGLVGTVFRWAGGETTSIITTALDNPAISPDGTTIVGTLFTTGPTPLQAFRWTNQAGVQLLEDFPGGSTNLGATDVSADGQKVVGSSGHPVFWTGTLPFRLDALGSGAALGVSADGNVIVGLAGSPQQAFRWTPQDGMVGLPFLDGARGATAHSVSADGSVVVGVNFFPFPPGTANLHDEAFRWTQSDGTVSLGDLAGGRTLSTAYDVSADGFVIVGVGETAFENGVGVNEAFYWTADTGMLNLRDVLVAGGATGLDGWRLSEARGVSYDGLTVVGTAIDPNGVSQAFVATIPEPSTVVLAALAAAALFAVQIGKSRRNRS